MDLIDLDADDLFEQYGPSVRREAVSTLTKHPDFIELGSLWFVESLLVEIDTGHLHLSEAILEMYEGGPLMADDILAHLDLDPAIGPGVQRFSLDYALLKDDRFDNVAGGGQFTLVSSPA